MVTLCKTVRDQFFYQIIIFLKLNIKVAEDELLLADTHLFHAMTDVILLARRVDRNVCWNALSERKNRWICSSTFSAKKVENIYYGVPSKSPPENTRIHKSMT